MQVGNSVRHLWTMIVAFAADPASPHIANANAKTEQRSREFERERQRENRKKPTLWEINQLHNIYIK